MKYYIFLVLKGMSMGIANVIPGVSGGTIALITEIYEELLNSLKSFDKKSLQLLISWDISGFIKYTNLYFLISIFGGSIISVISIANIFEYLFHNYPIFIWAFFFGLILASIYFIGKRIQKWNTLNILILFIGILMAISISYISPAQENDNLFFIFICGIIGVSGMILPGLSGSFILILMGNYELLMVKAVANLDLTILSIFFLGSIVGLIIFSRLLSWIFKHYKDTTLAILTGFIIGSLRIIWPWKNSIESAYIEGQEKILSYQLYLPQEINKETIIASILILLGVLFVYLLESFFNKNNA